MAVGVTSPAAILNYKVSRLVWNETVQGRGRAMQINQCSSHAAPIARESQWLILAYAAMVAIAGILAAADMWAVFGEEVSNVVVGMWIIVSADYPACSPRAAEFGDCLCPSG